MKKTLVAGKSFKQNMAIPAVQQLHTNKSKIMVATVRDPFNLTHLLFSIELQQHHKPTNYHLQS